MPERKNTILIIEDDLQIRKMLAIILDSEEYKTVDADAGKPGVRLCASVKPDLVLADLGLPDIDGKEVIKAIREWSSVPIIVISVRDDDSEVVAALDAGADDYVTKPFSADVLLARVRASLRKATVREIGEAEIVNGPIRMDLVRHEVYLAEKKTSFTPKEYDLLRYLLINRGKMLTHKQILKDVWGMGYQDNVQYLRVYIGQVRDKLAPLPDLASVITTDAGIGYRMESL
jgi:two-component system, OmpR family, KDP operon response regulator KdpE